MESREKIAFFAYCWSAPINAKLDIYLAEFVNNFCNMGFDVDIYIANEYVEKDGIIGINSNINLNKINKYIKSKKYKIILSINNALLTRRLDALKLQPVVSLNVDEFNHLFNHDKMGIYDQFDCANYILFSSYSHIKKLELNNFRVKSRLHFLPTATLVPNKSERCEMLPKQYNVSWVANLLDVSAFTLLYKRCIENSDRVTLIKEAINIVREGGHINYNRAIGVESISSLLEEHRWSRPFFEMQIQNVVSNSNRIAVVDRLHGLGLSLFGNHEWINIAANNPNVLNVYYAGNIINSHEDIMRIYNSSKICINMSQLQSGAALPYRVIDILASDALLITNYHSDSDAFKIFGKECPIVMYKDLDELYSLCEYYLSHEHERRRLVAKCNEMVRYGFDFRDRCNDILGLCGISSAHEELNPGGIHYVKSVDFVFWYSRAWFKSRLILKGLFKSLILLLPIRLRRSLIINLNV